MGSVKENLIAARALIDTPEKWGRGQQSYSRWSGDDFPLCAAGACSRAARRDLNRWASSFGEDELDALAAAVPAGFRTIAHFNDDPSTAHADIMALFSRAIASQEKGAGE